MPSESLKILYTQETILEKVTGLADQVSRDYPSGNVLLVAVLKGAFVFLADFIRALKIPVFIDFVQLSSYGTSSVSSGKVKILKDVETSVTGKDVIVIEDIIDTGLTVKFLKEELSKRKPRSLKICALLDKNFRRQVAIDADYVGISMDKDYFIVGYGLDFSESYRHLPEIYYINS